MSFSLTSKRPSDLTAAMVIRHSIRVGKDHAFVYFLIAADEVVYIGKTTFAPHTRVAAHVRKGIPVDRVAYMGPYTESQALQLETLLIGRFRPRHNGTLRWNTENEYTEAAAKRRPRTLPPPWKRYGYPSRAAYLNELHGRNQDGTERTAEQIERGKRICAERISSLL